MAYKMRLLDKTGAFHIQMPHLTGNISASSILNNGWLGGINKFKLGWWV